MRSLYSVLSLLCFITFHAAAQTVILDPATVGGFETGTTFASNGWTAVNPATAANQWYVGATAGSFAGARAVYVTNTAAGPYTYTLTANRVCHFYRDVVVPAGAVNITLSFKWKGFGESGFDRMLVFTAPTSVTPVANAPASPATTITGATLQWTQPNATTSAYTAATVPLPAALAGTTVRVIFTWQNNNSGGVTPGGALDNISMTYDCTAPAAITGTATLCAGTTTALSDASPSGTWSSSTPTVGTVSASGVVTGFSQGTTTISYTTTCLSPATRVVSVTGVPAAFTGPSTVCIGSTMTLGETTTGGTWTSSAPAIASVAGGVVSGHILGTANISYTTGCGAPVGRTVTVISSPAAIAGPATVCEGGATIVLSDATTGGTWSSSTPALATAYTAPSGMAIITGIAAGTVTITYTSSASCIATRVLTVSPLPAAITGIVPVCVGGSMTLSNAAGGGSWSSSVPGVATADPFSGLVTGMAGGTTLISYTNSCGTGTATVTISALPAPITGHDTVCIGAYTTLADVTVGGTWSSSNPAVASVGTGSGLITGNAVGTTYISYIMPGGCYATDLLTSYLVPSAISGTMQLCPGGTTVLANSTSGGIWTSSNPVAATIGSTSGLVSGHSADTVSMIYTTPSGCVVTALVTVNPLPQPILGRGLFCATDVDTLSDLTPGGGWNSLNPGVATIDASGIMTTHTGGNVVIRYTLPTGCAITRSFTVNPAPTPSISFDYFYNTFYTSLGYAAYQWYDSAQGAIPGANTYKTAGQVHGNYYVVVTDANGCKGASVDFHYDLSMAVHNIAAGISASIYPNPSAGMVYIQCAVPVKAVISTVDGRVEMTRADAREMDISSLPAGAHFITLYDNYGTQLKTQKLIKQ